MIMSLEIKYTYISFYFFYVQFLRNRKANNKAIINFVITELNSGHRERGLQGKRKKTDRSITVSSLTVRRCHFHGLTSL